MLVLVRLTMLVTLAAGLAVVQAPASAETRRCFDNGGQYPRCITAGRSERRLKVVEAVPFTNRTDRRQNYQCSFSQTISRSIETGRAGSGTAGWRIFNVVDASVSVTVHKNVTQTGEQATSAGFSGYVEPGETIVCERTFGFLVTPVRVYQYYTNAPAHDVRSRVRTPVNLGVRVRHL